MRIGILGGGQLGRMLALEGIPLGHRFTFLEPAPDPPAGALGRVVAEAYDSARGLGRLAATSDVISCEFENVPAASARWLAARVPVHPRPGALEVAQDRLAEKRMFRKLGIATPAFHPIDGVDDLEPALAATGLPAVIKTRRFGYDGKGQVVARTEAAAAAAVERMGSGLIAEAFVDFDRELSVLAASGAEGGRVFYPLTENHHRGGILRLSHAPAPRLAPALQVAGERIATRILDHLGYVGVLAVELFQCGNALLANEIAPRVHNSGHWTLDGADASQFENHIRAVTGFPLVAPRVPGPATMVNLIGDLPDPAALARIPGARLHLYDKAPRPGRKLGHVNVIGANREAVMRGVEGVLALAGANR